MSHRNPRWLLALVALLAVVSVGWQAFVGPLEHAGVVPHDPGALVAGAKTAAVPIESGHHHHVADLTLPPLAPDMEPGVSLVVAMPGESLPAPESPVASIERPPQLL